MKRLILVVGLLAASACVPGTDSGGGYGATADAMPVHPDPLCFYTEPMEPGGPLEEVCA